MGRPPMDRRHQLVSRFRDAVLLRARKRLVRELCRALASGLTPTDVDELLLLAQAHQREGSQP